MKQEERTKRYVVTFTMAAIEFPISYCTSEEEAIESAKWYFENDPDKYEQYIGIEVREEEE